MEALNILQKLNKARENVRNMKIGKDGKNTFSNYKYFTPEIVENIVWDACKDLNVIILCSLKQDAYGYFQVLSLRNLDNLNDFVDFELRTERGDIKATNAAQQMGGTDTYSERYIKMKVFQIKDNSLDFDSQDNRPKEVQKYPKPGEKKGGLAPVEAKPEETKYEWETKA